MKNLVTAEVNSTESIYPFEFIAAHVSEVANCLDFYFVWRTPIHRDIISIHFDTVRQRKVARIYGLILWKNQLRSCQVVNFLWIDGELRETRIQRNLTMQRFNLNDTEFDAIQQKNLRGRHYL